MITIHTQLIGQPQELHDQRGRWRSAIFRLPVDGPLALGPRGLAGDGVADTENHGSPDQAVCCEPLAHYGAWNADYGLHGDRALGPGSVGENWTVAGADEREVCIGDVWRVGGATVQVSAPRYPCTKQDRKLGLDDFQKRTVATMRTGWYLRVLEPGQVRAGDRIELVERPQPDLTVELVNAGVHRGFDRELALRLLDVPELGSGWKRILGFMLERKA